MSLDLWRRDVHAPSAATTGAGRERSTRLGRLRRDGAGPLVVLAALLVLVVIVGLLVLGQVRQRERDVPLDPANPREEGTRALVHVLADHGVRVDVARNQRELLDLAPADAGTTVLVAQPDELGTRTLERARQFSAHAGQVVLVQPRWGNLDAWGARVEVEGAPRSGRPTGSDYLEAGCTAPGLSPTDRIASPEIGYRLRAGASGTECFSAATEPSATSSPRSSALVITEGSPRIAVLGSTDVLTNGEIVQLDHAGVALRLLGRGDRVVWYDPDPQDMVIGEDPADGRPDPPPWLGPAALLSLFALLGAMLWRGRRLGRLVTEPLPAVVKAIETTQSRGRLYQRARDSDRAAQVLRAASTRRLAVLTGLPPTAAADQVAAPVASVTGRRPADVRHLLAGDGTPTSEPELLRLAQDLSTLEKEVRRA